MSGEAGLEAAKAAFGRYLATFARLAAGSDPDPAPLREHYAVPLTLVTADGVEAYGTERAVAARVREELERAQAAGYGRSVVASSDWRVLHERAVLHELDVTRETDEGDPVVRLLVRYVLVDADGWRIAVMTVDARAPG